MWDCYGGSTDPICSWSSGRRVIRPKLPDLESVKEQNQAAWSRTVCNVLLKVNAFISIKSKNSNNEPCFKNTVGKHWQRSLFLFQISKGFTINYVNPLKNTLIATFGFKDKL